VWRFLLGFLVIQIVLFSVELLEPVQEAVILPWTSLLAQISAGLVTPFDEHVVASGKVLRDSVNGFAVSIEPGCNGVEAMIVLASAVLAFPASWLYRLKGLLYGLLGIQLLNLVRIISLFYLGQWNEAVFDWAHLYVWQALIMLDALVLFLIWIRLMPRRHSAAVRAS